MFKINIKTADRWFQDSFTKQLSSASGDEWDDYALALAGELTKKSQLKRNETITDSLRKEFARSLVFVLQIKQKAKRDGDIALCSTWGDVGEFFKPMFHLLGAEGYSQTQLETLVPGRTDIKIRIKMNIEDNFVSLDTISLKNSGAKKSNQSYPMENSQAKETKEEKAKHDDLFAVMMGDMENSPSFTPLPPLHSPIPPEPEKKIKATASVSPTATTSAATFSAPSPDSQAKTLERLPSAKATAETVIGQISSDNSSDFENCSSDEGASTKSSPKTKRNRAKKVQGKKRGQNKRKRTPSIVPTSADSASSAVESESSRENSPKAESSSESDGVDFQPIKETYLHDFVEFLESDRCKDCPEKQTEIIGGILQLEGRFCKLIMSVILHLGKRLRNCPIRVTEDGEWILECSMGCRKHCVGAMDFRDIPGRKPNRSHVSKRVTKKKKAE